MKIIATIAVAALLTSLSVSTAKAQYYTSAPPSGGGYNDYSSQAPAPSGPVDYSNLSGLTEEQKQQEELRKQQNLPLSPSGVVPAEEDIYDAALRREQEERAKSQADVLHQKQLEENKLLMEEYQRKYEAQQHSAPIPDPVDLERIKQGLKQDGQD